MPLDIVTIVAKNYLAHARTLARSFLAHHPTGRVFVLLGDRVDGYFDPAQEPFTLIEVEQLSDWIPDLQRLLFQYSVLELATAVKPFVLEYLFRERHCRTVAYFDPDILITHDLSSLAGLLEHHAIVLTPHLTAQLNDSSSPSEVNILQAGTYNLGFIGVRNDPVTHRLLEWWKARLLKHCIMDPAHGYHVDQRWVDLVPGLFEGVYILREPGYNVAYWNLHERHITFSGGEPRCNAGPLHFFHFSGFSPDRPEVVSQHQDRHRMPSLGPTREMFETYARLLADNSYHDVKKWPYAFGAFENGVRIPQTARRVFLKLADAEARAFRNPFAVASQDSFFHWVTAFHGHSLPPLLQEIYQSHPDLQRGFPNISARDRAPFLNWVVSSGAAELDLDEALLADVRRTVVPRNRRASRRTYIGLWVRRAIRHLYRYLRSYPVLHPALDRAKSALGARLMWPHWAPEHWALPDLQRRGTFPAAAFRAGNGAQGGIGVNVAGYIQSEKGVGTAVRSSLYSLESAGIAHAMNSVWDPTSTNNDTQFTRFSPGNPYPINLIHVNASQVPTFVRDKGVDYFRGHYNIGYWMWELSTFPPRWVSCFDPFDEVWVPSTFTLDAVSRVSPVPVVRIPLCVHFPDRDAARAQARDHFGLPATAFIYFFMFDFHSYMARKNPLGLIKAFTQAFSPGDDALLLIKCSHSRWSPRDWRVLTRHAERHARVRLLDAVMPADEVMSLLSAIDCYVSLHRCEGFGLTLAEAMAMGKPVIATGYSGNMDFMTSANGYLVKYALAEVGRDYGPYALGSVWADPDVGDAARLMRFVYEHPDHAARTGRIAEADIRRDFSAAAVGKSCMARLRRIMEEGEDSLRHPEPEIGRRGHSGRDRGSR